MNSVSQYVLLLDQKYDDRPVWRHYSIILQITEFVSPPLTLCTTKNQSFPLFLKSSRRLKCLTACIYSSKPSSYLVHSHQQHTVLKAKFGADQTFNTIIPHLRYNSYTSPLPLPIPTANVNLNVGCHTTRNIQFSYSSRLQSCHQLPGRVSFKYFRKVSFAV